MIFTLFTGRRQIGKPALDIIGQYSTRFTRIAV